MATSHNLTAAQASAISMALLEFESLNTKRQLVDALVAQGVTLATYREWAALGKKVALGVSDPLRIDIENMLSHVESGIDVSADALHRMTSYGIKKAAKRAAIAQQENLDAS